jgi:hypothetical protein
MRDWTIKNYSKAKILETFVEVNNEAIDRLKSSIKLSTVSC